MATIAGHGAKRRVPKPTEIAPLPSAYSSAARVRPTRTESQPPMNTPGTPRARISAAHWLAVEDAAVGEKPRYANAAARKAASHGRTMKRCPDGPTFAS